MACSRGTRSYPEEEVDDWLDDADPVEAVRLGIGTSIGTGAVAAGMPCGRTKARLPLGSFVGMSCTLEPTLLVK